MNRLLINLALILSILSCSVEREPNYSNSEKDSNIEESLLSPELAAIREYIKRNKQNVTRAEDLSLKPYIVEGDTVMFIANYGEEYGWEVFSNDLRMPMVLFKSETGTYIPSISFDMSPFDIFFKETAEKLLLLKKDINGDVDVNQEWCRYNQKLLKPQKAMSRQEDGEVSFEWRWVGSSESDRTENVYEPRNGRLVTSWGQGENYNQFTPYFLDDSSKHSLVGCLPVAFGQFMYHSHYNFGVPASTVTEGVYNANSNKYIFSGSSTTIWDSFNSDPDMSFSASYMIPTAVFLGSIGNAVDVNYGKIYNKGVDKYGNIISDGTGSSLRNPVCINYFKTKTGLNVNVRDLTTDNVKSVLQTGHPAVIQLTHTTDYNAHVLIIDYLYSREIRYDNYYACFPIGDGDDDTDMPYIPENPTLDLLQELFGGIEVESVNESYSYYKMNWGWYGNQNEVAMNTALLEWKTENYTYNSKTGIMYCF